MADRYYCSRCKIWKEKEEISFIFNQCKKCVDEQVKEYIDNCIKDCGCQKGKAF